jgi:predicted DNA-binding transcriptional regulator AlpA
MEPELMKNRQLRFLTKGEMLERVGVSYAAVWGWIKEGKFPPGRAIGFGKHGHVAWVEDEVMDWLASRPARYPKGTKQKVTA